MPLLQEKTRTIDPETAAAGEEAQPRLSRAAFRCTAHADLHLSGQVCHVLHPDLHEGAGALVIFACGCRALVPTTALEPAINR